jgi:hypothetical protein
MTPYATLTRQQALDRLAVAGVWHDALTCHRDGSFTLRCGYHTSPVRAEANVAKLTRNTKAIILRERHGTYHKRDVYIEVRFAFEKQ